MVGYVISMAALISLPFLMVGGFIFALRRSAQNHVPPGNPQDPDHD